MAEKRGSRGRAPVALVTGAGRGIGAAAAALFGEEGWAVGILERRAGLGRATERRLLRAGMPAVFAQGDVSRWTSVRRAVDAVTRELGPIDCLVNNAGVLVAGELAENDPAGLARLVGVNLLGPVLVTRAVLPGLASRGSVVNIASGLGRHGLGGFAAYCATKFGVVGFTEALADELASGQRTWAVCPGLVDTDMPREQGVIAGRGDGRLLRPEEVARVVVDLACRRRTEPSGAAVDVRR